MHVNEQALAAWLAEPGAAAELTQLELFGNRINDAELAAIVRALGR